MKKDYSQSGWPKAWAAFRMAKEVWQEDAPAGDDRAAHAESMVFPIGQKNDAFSQYFIGQSYLAPVSTEQVGIFNVSHLAVEVPSEGGSSEWLEPVDDDVYMSALC